MSKTNFGVALLGCGTVGRGVYELLHGQIRDIENKYGFEFEVRKILVRDPNKPRAGLEIDTGLLTTRFDEIVDDPTIDIVIEVMGQEKPTKEYILEALRARKHVITANKALMGGYGEKLIEKARSQSCFLGFSAAVTGFHQFVPSMVKSILITELMGIFNGTTNFILTKLADKPFQSALEEAKHRGYAESDHTNDTSGQDTRNKLVVATKLAFGIFVDRDEIPVTGIMSPTNPEIAYVTKQDIAYASQLGYAIKLLGVSRIIEGEKLTAFVGPALVPKGDPLASISGVNNGILVHDKFRGVQGMSAAGAGKDATAMAIFSDLLSIARGEKILWPDAGSLHRICTYTRTQPPARFYVRVDVPNRPGVLAGVSKAFSRHEINILQVRQWAIDGPPGASIVFILDYAKPRAIENVLAELVKDDAITNSIRLRIEHSPKTKADCGTSYCGEESEMAAATSNPAELIKA